jgi:hypothetical protein
LLNLFVVPALYLRYAAGRPERHLAGGSSLPA